MAFVYADDNPAARGAAGGSAPPMFTPARCTDREQLAGLEFLRAPISKTRPRRFDAPPAGAVANPPPFLAPPTASPRRVDPKPEGENARAIPGGIRVDGPSPRRGPALAPSTASAMNARGGAANLPARHPPAPAPSPAASARPPPAVIFEDDFADDALMDIDVDALAMQRKASASAPAPAPAGPPPPEAPPKPPPLDGSGIDWRCEHGCALRRCAKLAGHVAELRNVIDSIEYTLYVDEDVVMSNRERKELERQRAEAAEVARFAAEGGGAEIAAAGPASAGPGGIAIGGFPPGPRSEGGGYPPGPQGTGGGYPSGAQSGGGGYPPGPQGTGGGYPPGPQSRGGGYPPGAENTGGGYPPGPQSGGGGFPPPSGRFDDGGRAPDSRGGALRDFGGGEYGGGGGTFGGGDFGGADWSDRPAPGDAAAYIPEKDCEFVDHEVQKWSRETFPWSSALRRELGDVFNAADFRGMQLATINCTLAGEDCLVLMPTGGGKSLCYQLPALINPGVTVVISPLVSLIQDQLHHLSEMGIPAAVLGSAESEGHAAQQETYDRLHRQPEPDLKLLYLTPEKVARSGKLMNALERVHRRGMLSRIVVDEVHCISSWGHDFRKDYKSLRILKDKFRDVPVIGLTATATKRVQDDCVRQLGLERCTRFFQTFNRTNIMYDVVPKKKAGKSAQNPTGVIEDMKALIHKNGYVRRDGKVACGIVYCFSQNDCEKVAAALTIRPRTDPRFPKGIAAVPYHAGLTDREERQRQWSNGKAPIICATVAFGMGINKPDVRFVFHHSIPKSLEAYHQESGRAGRDGAMSTCTLFYSYGDAQKARSMLQDSAKQDNSPREQLENNLDALNSLVSYCENKSECRRTLLLRHFNETFDARLCKGNCDVCQAKRNGAMYEERDVSHLAAPAADAVMELGRHRAVTMNVLTDIIKGSAAKTIVNAGYDRLRAYKAGKDAQKSDIERVLRFMVIKGVLREQTTRQGNGYNAFSTASTTVHADERKCRDLVDRRARLTMTFALSDKMAAQRRGEANEAAHRQKQTETTRGRVPTVPSSTRANANAGPSERAASNRAERSPAEDPSPDDLSSEPVDEDRYDALYEALNRMRHSMAQRRAQHVGRHVADWQVMADALLERLAKSPPASLETLQGMSAKASFASSDSIFLRNHAGAVWKTIENALAAYEGKPLPHEVDKGDARGDDARGAGSGEPPPPPGASAATPASHIAAYAFRGTQEIAGGSGSAKRPAADWRRAGQENRRPRTEGAQT